MSQIFRYLLCFRLRVCVIRNLCPCLVMGRETYCLYFPETSRRTLTHRTAFFKSKTKIPQVIFVRVMLEGMCHLGILFDIS